MITIAIEKYPTEPLSQQPAQRGLTAAGHAHQDDDHIDRLFTWTIIQASMIDFLLLITADSWPAIQAVNLNKKS
jgi:hypothetical protein